MKKLTILIRIQWWGGMPDLFLFASNPTQPQPWDMKKRRKKRASSIWRLLQQWGNVCAFGRWVRRVGTHRCAGSDASHAPHRHRLGRARLRYRRGGASNLVGSKSNPAAIKKKVKVQRVSCVSRKPKWVSLVWAEKMSGRLADRPARYECDVVAERRSAATSMKTIRR